jgi:hypothetical protein
MQSDWMTELYQRYPALAPKRHKATARRKKLARKMANGSTSPPSPATTATTRPATPQTAIVSNAAERTTRGARLDSFHFTTP